MIMHMVTVARGAVRNLTACVGRCHLEIEDLVLSSYAAGRAVLVDDELSLGAICIDLGAGASAIGAFAQGELVFADSVPVGGAHITNDIAYCLSTPPAEATAEPDVSSRPTREAASKWFCCECSPLDPFPGTMSTLAKMTQSRSQRPNATDKALRRSRARQGLADRLGQVWLSSSA